MDGKFIAYYRVSTEHQGAIGNGMAAQRKSSVGSPWRSRARIPALGGWDTLRGGYARGNGYATETGIDTGTLR